MAAEGHPDHCDLCRVRHWKERAEKAEARLADMTRIAECAEDMRDKSDARVAAFEDIARRMIEREDTGGPVYPEERAAFVNEMRTLLSR